MQPNRPDHHFDRLQKTALGLMAAMVLLSFIATNAHTLLWQSSDWLVSTVLPAVVVDLTNVERTQNAAQPLTRNATLDAAAKLKAEHMAQNEYFSHYSPDGVSPWHWFGQVNYVFAHAGENLAIHFTDSDEVVEAWMNSPAHRENIVAEKFTEIGVGTAKGEYEGYDTVYVVQLFGTPAVPRQPVVTPVVAEATEEAVQEPAVADDATSERLALADTVAQTSESESEATDTPEAASAQEERTDQVLAANDPTESVEQSATVEPEPETVLETPASAAPSAPVAATDVAAEDPAIDREVAEMPGEAPIAAPQPEDHAEPTAPPAERDTALVLEESLIATSSGLAIAEVRETRPQSQPSALAAAATKPNQVLELLYVFLGTMAATLLVASMVIEVRRHRVYQAAYGLLLLVAMSALWAFHTWLTAGAVIA